MKLLGIIIFVGLIITCLYQPINYTGFRIEERQKIDSSFHVSWGKQEINTKLSCYIDNPNRETIYIKKVLHKGELGRGDSILFRNRQSAVKAYLDDELIYESGDGFNYPFLMGYGSFWKSIAIGSNYDGKVLSLELQPGYSMHAVSGYLPNIYFGTQSAFIISILKSVAWYLFLTSILMIFGIFEMIYGSILLYRNGTNRMFLLGLFASDIALWMLIETHTLEIFINRIHIVIYLSYLTYSLMPILLIRFLLSYDEFKDKLYLRFIYLLGILLTSTELICSMIGIRSEFELQGLNRIYLGLIVIGLLMALFSIRATKKGSHLYNGVLILVLSTVLELLYFIFVNKQNSGRILILGITLFILKSGIDLIHQMRKTRKLELERKILKEMAYKDAMTHLGNRFAYEQEKNNLEEKIDVPIIILIVDINGLKQINDFLGHIQGNQIICKTAEVLKTSFYGIGTCFRLGGDEFCILAQNIDRSTFDACINQMKTKVSILKQDIPYYDISYGIAEGLSRDIEDIYHNANNFMYTSKKKMRRARQRTTTSFDK